MGPIPISSFWRRRFGIGGGVRFFSPAAPYEKVAAIGTYIGLSPH
jgi:hypothetical protein